MRPLLSQCPDKEDASYQCGAPPNKAKCKAIPGLTDPLQLYSLFEVDTSKTEGTGDDAILTCKCVDKYFDRPIDFLADFGHAQGTGGEGCPSMLDSEISEGFNEGDVITRCVGSCTCSLTQTHVAVNATDIFAPRAVVHTACVVHSDC